jgi:hypothetical protein
MLRQLVAREEDCGKPAVARTMISGHPFYVCAEHVLPGDLRLRELP